MIFVPLATFMITSSTIRRVGTSGQPALWRNEANWSLPGDGTSPPWETNRIHINESGTKKAVVDSNDTLLRIGRLQVGTGTGYIDGVVVPLSGEGEVLQTGGVISSYDDTMEARRIDSNVACREFTPSSQWRI